MQICDNVHNKFTLVENRIYEICISEAELLLLLT